MPLLRRSYIFYYFSYASFPFDYVSPSRHVCACVCALKGLFFMCNLFTASPLPRQQIEKCAALSEYAYAYGGGQRVKVQSKCEAKAKHSNHIH